MRSFICSGVLLPYLCIRRHLFDMVTLIHGYEEDVYGMNFVFHKLQGTSGIPDELLNSQ